ncbi:uncharacterized protein LOC127971501 isoform X2 [Carassius gibelio]|uniref:uncharacterized protein LOC127971501 isoform X2 n=1 Tax=Carassius gibelio TaxID=101364 RepID=UPI002277C5B5|nr:uncharacterized protein LOC127971501 isoform X2 [Carassius gibelio]
MVSLVFINSHFKSNLFMCDHESSHYLTGNLMFCAQSNGYETIVNEIKALNAGARPPQPNVAYEVPGVRTDITPAPASAQSISTVKGRVARENRGSLSCLRQLVNRYPSVTTAERHETANSARHGTPLGRRVVVTAQIHSPPQISTNSTPVDCTGSFANSIPQAVADAGVRRPWVKSRSHHEHQNVTAPPVQPDRQKTVDPCEIDVIPNTPERKRPRQSTQPEDKELWDEHFAQAWDGCDMNVQSNVDQEKNLNQPTDTVENVADSDDDDADKLPSNQEEYKNQQLNDTNNDILNTIVKNQERIIEDQARHKQQNDANKAILDTVAKNQEHHKQQNDANKALLDTVAKNQERIIEDQARHKQQNDANKAVLDTVVKEQQKQGIILKHIVALLKRHHGAHAKTACDQEMTVTLLTELLDLFK